MIPTLLSAACSDSDDLNDFASSHPMLSFSGLICNAECKNMQITLFLSLIDPSTQHSKAKRRYHTNKETITIMKNRQRNKILRDIAMI